MKFEHFLLKPYIIKYLLYHFEILNFKKNQLKLGKVIFVIKQNSVNGLLFSEELVIKYINQDTTNDDLEKASTWDSYFSWKWDWIHIFSFLIILKIIMNNFKSWIYSHFLVNWLQIFAKPIYADYLVKICIESLYNTNSLSLNKNWVVINHYYVDVIIDFCSFFNILF